MCRLQFCISDAARSYRAYQAREYSPKVARRSSDGPHRSAVLDCVFLAGASMAVGVCADTRRSPCWMAIEADYRGGRVTLIGARDKNEFSPKVGYHARGKVS